MACKSINIIKVTIPNTSPKRSPGGANQHTTKLKNGANTIPAITDETKKADEVFFFRSSRLRTGCFTDLVDDGIGAAAFGRKVDLHQGIVEGGLGRPCKLVQYCKAQQNNDKGCQQKSIFHNGLPLQAAMGPL